MLIMILAIFGAVVLFLSLLNFLWTPLELISSYLMPFFLPAEVEPLSKRFGPWAAVTGCTDGIGKYYALELARRGLDIVLISRNPEKLNAVAKEIEQTHRVKTKIIVADFTRGADVYPQIEEQLKDIDLGILVNNVGLNYDCPALLCDVPASKSWDVLTVNVGAVTMLSRAVLPRMVARGRGALVNISSGSELQPFPLMSVYAATKAYVRSFTHAIREEYAPKGIYIQHVAPFFVATKMNAFSETVMAGGGLLDNVAYPDSYARYAVNMLGRVQNTTGYWKHGIQLSNGSNLFVATKMNAFSETVMAGGGILDNVAYPDSYARYAVNMLGRVQNTTGYWKHGIQAFVIQLVPEWVRMKVGKRMNEEFRKEHLRNQKTH